MSEANSRVLANDIEHAPVRRLVTIVLLIVATGCSARARTQPAPVGVLGITSEIVPIEQRLQDGRDVSVRGFVFRQGTLSGRQVVIGRTGTGKVNAAIATTVLIGHFSPTAVFFSGTAGAADPGLRLGDVVIGSAVAHHDIGQQTPRGLERRGPRHPISGELDSVLLQAPDVLVDAARRAARGLALPPMEADAGALTPRIVEGLIVTGEMFVANVTQREELRKNLNAAAVEMEGAAVVQTCRYFGVHCLVVRSITDRADGQAMTSYQALRTRASENAAAVVAAIIGRLDAQ
jgi:adenosylhomocysteine nucleosidase